VWRFTVADQIGLYNELLADFEPKGPVARRTACIRRTPASANARRVLHLRKAWYFLVDCDEMDW